MNSNTRTSIVLLLGIIIGVSIMGQGVFAKREASPTALPIDEIKNLTEVFDRIKRDYVEKVSDKELMDSAIRGMLAGLDPHSSYLDEDGYKELQVSTSGEFGGLGIEVGMEDGFVKVISPIDDTPASRAGIQAGDLIIRLDNKTVKGMTLPDAVNIMRGKIGTDITLTVVREGAEKPLEIVITRDTIKVRSVKQRMLEPGYGYLRISQFQQHTGENLEAAIEKLTKENKGVLSGLILDLRNNPGGVLHAAVEVSDAFLDSGLVVYTKGRVQDSEQKYETTPKTLVSNKMPLLVLVNGGSASASEIVAGALQDHKRAIIVGTKTFGKGSVQTIWPLSNKGTALKLTTARYYTPSGRSIQADGIAPDIVLKRLKVTSDEGSSSLRIKEADLSGHLENESKKEDGDKDADKDSGKSKDKSAKGKKGDKDKKSEDDAPLAESDYQLYEALNILKGLRFISMR